MKIHKLCLIVGWKKAQIFPKWEDFDEILLKGSEYLPRVKMILRLEAEGRAKKSNGILREIFR